MEPSGTGYGASSLVTNHESAHTGAQIKVTRSAEIFGAYYGMKLALYRSLFWPDRKADVAYALPAALQAVHDISLLVENIVQRGMIDCWAFVCPVAMQSSLILVLSWVGLSS